MPGRAQGISKSEGDGVARAKGGASECCWYAMVPPHKLASHAPITKQSHHTYTIDGVTKHTKCGIYAESRIFEPSRPSGSLPRMLLWKVGLASSQSTTTICLRRKPQQPSALYPQDLKFKLIWCLSSTIQYNDNNTTKKIKGNTSLSMIDQQAHKLKPTQLLSKTLPSNNINPS